MAIGSGQFLAKRVYNEATLYASILSGLDGEAEIGNLAQSISVTYNTAANGIIYPDAGFVPRHAIFTNGYTRWIIVLGARTRAQFELFYAASFLQRRGVDEYCNRASILAGEIILAHADDFQANPANQIVAGHSYGGTIVQAIAMALVLNVPANATFKCFMFGAPRQWQRVDRFPGGTGWNFYRYNNDEDPLPHFPPHADEAPVAVGLQTAAIRAVCARVEHVGQGVTLYADGSFFRADVPNADVQIQDAYLWGWFLNNDSYGARAHAIREYRQRLARGFEAAEGDSTLSLQELDPRVLPIVEDAGRLMRPAEAAAQVAIAEERVKQNRGVEPDQPPFYIIKRAGVWNCECEGNVISAGKSRRNAGRMARTLNAAWRAWWQTKLADTFSLSTAVQDFFPS